MEATLLHADRSNFTHGASNETSLSSATLPGEILLSDGGLNLM
jgi:hypothetical protein